MATLVTPQQFTQQFAPLFTRSQIPFKLIDNRKSFSKTHQVVTIFEKEYQPENTFVCIQETVYRLNHRPVKSDFKVIQNFSPCVKYKFEPENFTPFTGLNSLPQDQQDKLWSNPMTTVPVSQAHTVVSGLPDWLSDETRLQDPDDVSLIPVTEDEYPQIFNEEPETPIVVLNSLAPEPISMEGLDLSTAEGFGRFLENRFERVRLSMVQKGVEYRKGGNVFHNFDSTGRMNDQLPERALWGMVSKQITSMKDMIVDLENGVLPPVDLLQERSKDLVNYFLLLEALMFRTIQEHTGFKQAA
ncbi:hypothetical protein CLV58_109216 [Spirosoma oryzae]|uniref:Uncharacterized protein n=1 Tax=Spirosoma oryzae TaxID=1469603 RepID=A0A2T0SYM1_9BACT|nr:hypothetical protein [Spirosoma oryzae]PRY38489.1 hypothetical protein CLV58_109216 [Spirosoma oryzae]